MDSIKYDTKHILKEHQEALQLLFDAVDLSKITFVGGIADYLNLRTHFKLPINDIDMVFSDYKTLEEFGKIVPLKRFKSTYHTDTDSVFIGNYTSKGHEIHFDFFKQYSIHKTANSKSSLLGQTVYHTTFKGMQDFHNGQIASLTSDVTKDKYDWKRLYKHSRKAALYNLLCYKQEKEQLTYES